MLKKNKNLIVLTTLVTLLPVLVGVLLWGRLPERLVTSFSWNGETTGTSSRAFTVFAIPLFIAAMHLFCIFGTLSDPKRQNHQQKIWRLILWICPATSLLLYGIVYSYALGWALPVNRLMMLFLGALFLIIGNYLPKCRQTYTIGIRLPWTLASEENWNRTHRMAGGLWVLAGVVMLLEGLLGGEHPMLWLALLAVASIAPAIYSYLFYRREKRES